MLFFTNDENSELLNMLCVGFLLHSLPHSATKHVDNTVWSPVAWIDIAIAGCSEEFSFRIPCAVAES